MKKTLLSVTVFVIGLTACKTEKLSSQDKEMNKFVDELMSKMTLEEKIGQTVLYSSWWDVTGPVSNNKDFIEEAKKGHVGAVFNALTADFLYRMQKEVVENSRLGIPLLFGYDVIHGYTTTFPTPLAMASSWDMEKIGLAARTMTQEAAADGLHWTFAPMVDIARDPRWGRVAEGAGEDAFLGSAIARAQVHAIQGTDLKDTTTLLACVKHFAAYGAAMGGRDYNSVDMSERHLREFYLPPFKAAFDAGCETVMASFNDINGVPATSNPWLLNDLLRKEWGFKGMVVSDYTGVFELLNHSTSADSADASAQSMNAGLDMDMQSSIFKNYLAKNVKDKLVKEERIDEACRRVLEMKYKLGLFEDPYRYSDTLRAKRWLKHPSFFQNAHEVAKRSIVLLKNDNNVLPLSKETKSIALIGPMVDNQQDQLGMWHTAGRKETVTTILEAFKTKIHDTKINFVEGCGFEGDDRKDFAKAIAAARDSEVVVLALGERENESGEAASKTDLRLASIQRDLIREISKVGKPVVLLLHSGRPLVLTEEEKQVNSILQVWHLGSMAGPAITDVTFGDYNPSGKITMSFPRSVGQIPVYYNYLNTGRPISHERFTSRYLDCANEPLYSFGHGLSYTNFEYSDITLDKTSMNLNDEIKASVEIKNTGKYDGEEVVQLYIRDRVASVSRPMKELKGFQKVFIPVGKSLKVDFKITKNELAFHNVALDYVVEAGDFDLFIGTASNNVKQTSFKLIEGGVLLRP